MIDADLAKRATDNINAPNSDKVQGELKQILHRVERAIGDGEYSIYIQMHPNREKFLVASLEQLGYKVTASSRNHNYFVEWR